MKPKTTNKTDDEIWILEILRNQEITKKKQRKQPKKRQQNKKIIWDNVMNNEKEVNTRKKGINPNNYLVNDFFLFYCFVHIPYVSAGCSIYLSSKKLGMNYSIDSMCASVHTKWCLFIFVRWLPLIYTLERASIYWQL